MYRCYKVCCSVQIILMNIYLTGSGWDVDTCVKKIQANDTPQALQLSPKHCITSNYRLQLYFTVLNASTVTLGVLGL